jgi:soluble lytic murein transglycosylase-like protein
MFRGWGTAHYETPAPVPPPQAAPSEAPAVAAKKPAHERAARIRHRDAVKVATAHDSPPAPTRVAEPAAAPSGPFEQGAPTIRDLVSKHARANGVPENLAAAVVSIESRFNPQARGGSALGLMQIKYDTARAMGYAGGVTALMAPDTNLHFGMKVLADAYKASHGDLCMTLARYQSGHRVTHASAANRAYCARARTFMARAS